MLALGTRTLGTKAAAYALGALTSILLARSLTPEQRGVWGVLAFLAGLVALLAESGIGTSATYLMRQASQKTGTILATSLAIVAVSASAWIAVASVALLAVEVFGNDIPRVALVPVLLSALPIAVTLVARTLLVTLEDVDGANGSVLVQALWLLAFLLVLFFLGASTATGVAIVFLVAAVLTSALTLSRLLAIRHAGLALEVNLVRPLISYGIQSHAAGLALYLLYRFDMIIVNHYLGARATGLYAIALALSEMLRGIPETAQVLVLAAARRDDLALHAARVSRLASVLTAVVGSGVALSGHWLVPAVFGKDYQGAAAAFGWLFPGIVGLAVSYSVSPVLALRGQVRWSLFAALVGLVGMVLLNTLLTPIWGISGAGAASSVAYWVVASIQIGRLVTNGHFRLSQLVPTCADIRLLGRG